MTRLRLRRPSPAMVVALVALFVAMGGASYAAFKVPKNSVGSKQIKANAVNGSKVKNHSLTGADVNAGTLGPVKLATQATNAVALGGSPASAYVKSPVPPSQFGTIPAVRVTHSSGEFVATATGTTLNFNTTEYDNGAMHSTTTNNSRLTARIGGVYEITGNVYWDPDPGGERDLYIVRNGQTVVGETGVQANTSGSTVEQVTTQVHLNAGDYVELAVYQASGANSDVEAKGDYSPTFAMHWLGS